MWWPFYLPEVRGGHSVADSCLTASCGCWDAWHLLHWTRDVLQGKNKTKQNRKLKLWMKGVTRCLLVFKSIMENSRPRIFKIFTKQKCIHGYLGGGVGVNKSGLYWQVVVQRSSGILPAELVIYPCHVPCSWEQILHWALRDVAGCTERWRKHENDNRQWVSSSCVNAAVKQLIWERGQESGT